MQRRTVLTTDRLILTTWLPDDAEGLYQLHSDPLTMRFVGPGRPETRAEVERRLRTYLEEQDARGWTKWRVTDESGALIGRAGFGLLGEFRDLGYTLDRRYWGLGLGTELAVALRDWHRRHLPPDRPAELSGFAAEENRASRRILEKVGFRLVETRAYEGVRCAFYRCAGTG